MAPSVILETELLGWQTLCWLGVLKSLTCETSLSWGHQLSQLNLWIILGKIKLFEHCHSNEMYLFLTWKEEGTESYYFSLAFCKESWEALKKQQDVQTCYSFFSRLKVRENAHHYPALYHLHKSIWGFVLCLEKEIHQSIIQIFNPGSYLQQHIQISHCFELNSSSSFILQWS